MSTASGSLSLDTSKMERAIALTIETKLATVVAQVAAMVAPEAPPMLTIDHAASVLYDYAPATSAGEFTPEAARFLADRLTEVGYALVAVDETKAAWYRHQYNPERTNIVDETGEVVRVA